MHTVALTTVSFEFEPNSVAAGAMCAVSAIYRRAASNVYQFQKLTRKEEQEQNRAQQ